MARVVDVLDGLFVLPVTSGAVGILEGRQCAPGDALGRLHHPLENPVAYSHMTCLQCFDRYQKLLVLVLVL